MKKIKNILIAVELDNESETVLEYGIMLGLLMDAKVHCIHISRPVSHRIIYDENGHLINDQGDLIVENDYPTIDELEQKAFEGLSLLINRVVDKVDININDISFRVKSDFAVNGILEESKEIKADLLVIGAHVDFKNKEFNVANLSRQIIKQSRKSVVVVPSSYGDRNLDHICMFINFAFEELTMIQDAIEFATKSDLKLSFIHVLNKDEKVIEADEKLNVYKRLFINEENAGLIHFNLKQGDIGKVIENLTSGSSDIDLLGFLSNKNHWNILGIQHSFNSKVLNHLMVPFYIWK